MLRVSEGGATGGALASIGTSSSDKRQAKSKATAKGSASYCKEGHRNARASPEAIGYCREGKL